VSIPTIAVPIRCDIFAFHVLPFSEMITPCPRTTILASQHPSEIGEALFPLNCVRRHHERPVISPTRVIGYDSWVQKRRGWFL
jgi:hypothetical protein